MFAGDAESEYSFDDQQMAPVAVALPCQAWRKSRQNPQGKQVDKPLVNQLLTPREREFGWSASLSGIRGPSEEQARRELEFIKSSHQQSRNRSSAPTRSRERVLEQDDELDRFLSLPDPPAYDIVGMPTWHGLNHAGYHYNRHGHNQAGNHSSDRSLVTRRLHSDDVQSVVPSPILSSHQRLSDCQPQILRENHPIRARGNRCIPVAPGVSHRRLARASSWMNGSDEVLYNAARKLDNSHQTSSKGLAADREKSTPGCGWGRLMRRLSRAKTKHVPSKPKHVDSNRMDEPNIAPLILSHQMVGSFSPFPPRAPLSTGSGSHPAPAAGRVGSTVNSRLDPSRGVPNQDRTRKLVRSIAAAGLC